MVKNITRAALSALLMSVLAACGGGGDDETSYPPQDTIVINVGTSAAPAGTYAVQDGDFAAETLDLGNGQVLASAFVEHDGIWLQIDFLQNDPSKYALLFEDGFGEYICRSAKLSNAEIAGIESILEAQVGEDLESSELDECDGDIAIDATARTAKADRVKIPGSGNSALSVTLSFNVSWPLPEAFVLESFE